MPSARRLAAQARAWGLPIAVLKKFSEDRASSLAALVAYYAFFALFPLLLALVSVLGFVLDGNPSLQDDVVDTALGRIPVIGVQLRDDVHPLTGSGVALAVGVVGALWAGLRVRIALGTAFAEIWDVPRLEQPSGLRSRGRGLAVLVILAAMLVAATVPTVVAVGGGVDAVVEHGAALIASLAINGVVFLAVFALLTPGPRQIRALLPGVALAAVGWLVLQALGGWYVDRVIADASATYGTFALVIGLLSWFWLGSLLVLLAAEVNVVLVWRLWPRSLAGEPEPADRRVPAGITACLFDLDGVLTRTVTIHAEAWKRMFDGFLRERSERNGEPFREFALTTDYDEYVDGKPRLAGVCSFLQSRGVDLRVDALGTRKNELVLGLIHGRGVEPYEGSVRFVEAARDRGLRRAVVSSSTNCKDVLEAAGIDHLFEARIDGVVAEREGLAGKPAPDTFLAGAGALGAEPAAAAVVEDALAGVEAGRAGRFGWIVGVDRSGQADALRDRGADVVVKDLDELL